MRILAWPAFVNRRSNPFNWQLYSQMTREGVRVEEYSLMSLLRGRYAVWHLHWPDFPLNVRHPLLATLFAAGLLKLMDLARARGTRIVWTVHNLRAHDGRQPALERWFWPRFTRRVDGYICLTLGGLNRTRQTFPALVERPGFVIPHGHYRQAYPNHGDRTLARRRLGLPPRARVLLYLGQIRPYKNVEELLEAFAGLQDPAAVLVVAGRVQDEALGQRLQTVAARDGRVRLHGGFVEEEAIQDYLNAADLVVLPYREVLNSGSALLALSFDRPVLAPELGALGELADRVGPDWLRTYRGSLTAGELAGGLDWSRAAGRPVRAALNGLEWPEIARSTLGAYRRVVAGPELLAVAGKVAPESRT